MQEQEINTVTPTCCSNILRFLHFVFVVFQCAKHLMKSFFLRSFYLKYKVHIKCKVIRHLHISKVFHLIVYTSPN